MKKPCNHEPPLEEGCHYCNLFLHDKRYRRLWSGETKVSNLKKATNFISALANHLFKGLPKTTDAEYNQRLSICSGCEQCDKSKERWECMKCGCYLKDGGVWPGKARWASQECPFGYWAGANVPLVEKPQPPKGCCGQGKAKE